VGGDRHAGRLGGHRRVDLADVAQVLVLGVVAPPGEHCPLPGIVEVGQAGVVELQVGAPEIAERRHLRSVGGAQVIPEPVDVRVHRRVDGRRPAPVVDHARRGDRQLGRRRGGHLPEGPEVVAEDRFGQSHRAVDRERRRLERQVANVVVELDPQGLLGRADPAQAVDEIHVPGGSPQLTVRRRPEADVLLHPHQPADGVVLHGAQLVGRDPTGGEVVAGP
jgi:hypothetical protein